MCRYNYPTGASIVKHFYFLEINVFIQQGCIQVIDIDSKDMLQKIACYFKYSIYQNVLKEINMFP